MRIGFALPQFDLSVPGESPLQWSTVADWARRAERAGFQSLWVCDHLFWDVGRYGGPATRTESYDPLPVLGALARVTTRARLGTLTLCAPLRSPAVLAKALATVDVLSGGRLTVGLGAGWYEPEFEAAGVPFLSPGVRLQQLGEAIDVLRGMWGGGPFSYPGRHWTVQEARCRPMPVQQPHPPLIVGGKGDKLLELATRKADGWNTVWVWTPEDYRRRLAFVQAAAERAGRDPSALIRSLGLYALVGEDEADLRRRFERRGVGRTATLDEWRQGRLVGTVEQVREQVAEWAAVGVDDLIVNTAAVPFAVVDADDVDMIASACSLEEPWEASEPRN